MEYGHIPWPFPYQGLNSELHATHVPPEALVTCENMFYQSPMRLRSRGAINLLYTGTYIPTEHAPSVHGGDILRMYYWSHEDETYFADDGARLWSTADNLTPVEGTDENVVEMIGFGVTDSPKLIVAEDKGAQDHTLHTWDGTTYAQLTGTDVPAGATRLMVRYDRLWATCDKDYPSRIFYSDVNDETVWSGEYNEGGYIDVYPGQDGDILDWVEFEGAVYVWKEQGLYRVSGYRPSVMETLEVERLTETEAVIARSAIDCGLGVLYANRYGVFPVPKAGAMHGTTRVPMEAEASDITRHIEREFQETLSDCYTEARETKSAWVASGGYGTIAEATACFSPELGAYLFAKVGETTIWVSNFNSRPDAWTKFTAPAAVHCLYQADKLYIGSANGVIYEYDHAGYEDDSEAFTVTLKTGSWNLGDPLRPKNVRFIQGMLNGNELAHVKVRLYRDAQDTALGTWTLTPGERNIIRLNFNCERVAYELEYTDLTAPCLFGGAQLLINAENKDALL